MGIFALKGELHIEFGVFLLPVTARITEVLYMESRGELTSTTIHENDGWIFSFPHFSGAHMHNARREMIRELIGLPDAVKAANNVAGGHSWCRIRGCNVQSSRTSERRRPVRSDIRMGLPMTVDYVIGGDA